jgi:ABC-2 type transport system permease protein
MGKIYTIARREFAAMVATKAFLLSITLMPLLMFGGVIAFSLLKGRMADVSDKRIVIADGTAGDFFAELQKAAEARNNSLTAAKPAEAGDDKDGPVAPSESRFVLERHAHDAFSDADRLELSNQVRDGKVKAFAEIPADILGDAPAAGKGPPAVQFYSTAAEFSAERRWLDQVVNEVVKARRFKSLALDPAIVARATASVPVVTRGLVKQMSGGRIAGGEQGKGMTSVFVPFAFMMLMFMIIMLSAQPLLETAMEEKNGRIAEVLLGSVNSFQLMVGKLLGNVAGSLTAVAIYGAGGYAAAAYNGWTDYIPWDLVPWFLVYQVLAVFFFSSLFMAVGASVTQLKEAQSMLLPVWLTMCVPMFVWLQLVREPNGPLAVGLSFFPPSAPLVMVLRLASEEVVPAWQIGASLVLMLAATTAVTFLAARIFRIGMLWQGKTPKLTELLRWAWSG